MPKLDGTMTRGERHAARLDAKRAEHPPFVPIHPASIDRVNIGLSHSTILAIREQVKSENASITAQEVQSRIAAIPPPSLPPQMLPSPHPALRSPKRKLAGKPQKPPRPITHGDALASLGDADRTVSVEEDATQRAVADRVVVDDTPGDIKWVLEHFMLDADSALALTDAAFPSKAAKALWLYARSSQKAAAEFIALYKTVFVTKEGEEVEKANRRRRVEIHDMIDECLALVVELDSE